MRPRTLLKSCLFATALLTLQGCVINIPPLFGGSRGPLAIETVVPAEGFFTRDQILMIDLSGIVDVSTGGLFGSSPGMLVKLKDRLNEARQNDRIKAVLLRIDSPGGGVTASDLIHREIVSFKKDKDVPVVAMMQDIAASGGVYIAMAADEIYALPTTTTGSIGVIAMLPGLEGLSEKIGLEMRVIKSGENKDLGSPWRSLTEEEREIFQVMIDSMYERFLNVIVESRGPARLTRERLRTFADGRILTSEAAAEFGLIDGVMYLDEAIERTKQLAGLDDAALVTYEYPFAYRGNIYATGSAPRPRMDALPTEFNLLKVDLGLDRIFPSDARFLYMWLP